MKRYKPQAPGKTKATPPAKTEKGNAREQRQALFRYHQFIRHYLTNNGNATQAAILAGYDGKHAAIQGSQLLKLPYIQEKITAARLRLQERTEVSIEKVIAELAKMGFANMEDYISITPWGDAQIDLSDLTQEQWAAISEVTTEVYMEGKGDDAVPVKRTKIKLHDKLGSLEKIARYLGAFNGKRGGSGEPPEGQPEQVTNHYTLQIGNANINVGSQDSQGSGTEGAQAKVLALP